MQRSAAHGDITVVAVRYGELLTTRSHVFLNHSELGIPDAELVLAYYFWIIRTPDHTVVVDTGFDPAVGERRGRTVLIPPVEALRLLGVSENDEFDLVLTHAHYDHIGNVAAFPHARVYMARAEFEFWTSASATAPLVAQLVEDAELRHLVRLHREGRARLIDQSAAIAPGVVVRRAPGHTPGELIVLVASTPSVLLASDAVHVDEELERLTPFRHMCSLVQADETYRAIRAMQSAGVADVVVAGHEDAVSRRFPPLPGPLSAHAVVISGDPAAAAS